MSSGGSAAACYRPADSEQKQTLHRATKSLNGEHAAIGRHAVNSRRAFCFVPAEMTMPRSYLRSPAERHTLRAAPVVTQPAPLGGPLWSALSARRLGVQFRRQGPLAGAFIVDFAAASARMAVDPRACKS
jgi:hypothetical protein